MNLIIIQILIDIQNYFFLIFYLQGIEYVVLPLEYLLRFIASTPAHSESQSESENRSENESQLGLQHDSTRVDLFFF